MSEQAKMTDEIDLFSVLGMLWRDRWLIIISAFLALFGGVYYAYFVAVPKYSASTTLVLEIRNAPLVDIEAVVSGVSTEAAAINTEIEVLRSRELLKELVQEMSLTQDPEFNHILVTEVSLFDAIGDGIANLVAAITGQEQAKKIIPALDTQEMELNSTIEVLRNVIGVSNKRNTYVFILEATTEDRMKSARITNSLADLYVKNQIDIKFETTENAVAWLSERVVELDLELKAKERAVRDVQAQLDVSSPEYILALGQKSRELEGRVDQYRNEIRQDLERLERLKALKVDGEISAFIHEIGTNSLLSQLFEKASSGDLGAQRILEEQLDVVLAQQSSKVMRSEAKMRSLEASLMLQEENFAAQSQKMTLLQQLEREAESTRTLYETFLDRLKETSIQRGLQQADSRILSSAIPGRMVAPRKMFILAASMFIGGALGVMISILRQFRASGFRTQTDLEALTGLPTIGQIPTMPIKNRNMLLPYLQDNPTSAGVEAIRDLRTSLILSDVDNPPQVIMLTSSLPGEGKTTLAVSLAQNLSGLGKRVLLVEFDIRRRTLASYFDGLTPGVKLLDALELETPISEVVQTVAEGGFDIFLGAKTHANAADIFASDKFAILIKRFREEYDFVVMDTPPVLVVPDARIIAGLADTTVFAVKWDKTHQVQVIEALKALSSVGGKVAGTVLSQIDVKRMHGYGYGGKYGAYGAYSSYGEPYYDT